MSPDDPLDSIVFDRALSRLERFVVGDKKDGCRLCHPGFQEYLTGTKLTGRDQDKHRRNLLAYCARWQEHKSRYTLTHCAAHLADADRTEDLYRLIGRPWMQAKRDAFQSHRPFQKTSCWPTQPPKRKHRSTGRN